MLKDKLKVKKRLEDDRRKAIQKEQERKEREKAAKIAAEAEEEARRIIEEIILPFFDDMHKKARTEKELVIAISAWEDKKNDTLYRASFSVEVYAPETIKTALIVKSYSYENTEVDKNLVWKKFQEIVQEYGITEFPNKDAKTYKCFAMILED